MSITYENGRLCNQIFRNLCVSFIAKKHDLFVIYCNESKIKSLGISLFCGTNKYNQTIQLIDDNFFSILNREEPLLANLDSFSSFFQTKEISNFLYTYLQSQEINIKNANPFRERYHKNNDCFIHLRLTDVEHFNPGVNYYLDTISQIEFENLYIASDDINHEIINTIINKYPNAIKTHYDEVQTIQFGSTCKNIILSNGSYSAIIGYLSFQSNIYYPEYKPKKIWHGDMFSIPNWNCKKIII